jgi:hypothetical protein
MRLPRALNLNEGYSPFGLRIPVYFFLAVALFQADSGLGTGLAEQCGNPPRELCSLGYPVIHARFIDTQTFLMRGGDGIIEAHSLDEPPITGHARIRNNHVVKRALFSAGTG